MKGSKSSGMKGMGGANPQPKPKPGTRRTGPKVPIKKAKWAANTAYGGS